MSEGYHYKGRNLSTLILAKIEHVANLIAEREEISFEYAYRKFVDSRTFQILSNTQTLLWGESAEYIVDDYYRESVD